MKTFSKLTLIVFLFCGSCRHSQAQIPTYLSNQFQQVLDSVCETYQIKGTSAAIYIPNIGIWKGTNGTSFNNIPINEKMLFGMGSNTKTHIAALILKLQEQQLLSIHDTIGKWIPHTPNIPGNITIRQCLNHTSGLFDYLQNSAINDSIFDNPDRIWEMNDILKLALKPNFKPGTNFSYSNTNYIVMGIIINKVLNKSPYQAIKDYILDPIGLTNTYRYGEQPSTTDVAHPWTIVMNGTSLTDLTTTGLQDNLFSLASTAGSLISTAEDNVLFWHKLTSGQILTNASWKEMTNMWGLSKGNFYGLGIMRNTNPNNRIVYSHGGTFFGFINENMVDTLTGICFSVMTNQDSVNNDGLIQLLLTPLQKVLLDNNVGVNELASKQPSFKVFPNPASDIINIELPNQQQALQVNVFDNTGRLLATHAAINQLPINDLQNGVYWLQITNQHHEILPMQKFIVTH